MDLSFKERQDRLATRIRAHKEFANFDIDDWIKGFLARKPRTHIFDLGCGNGNHLGLYLAVVPPQGTVTGMDREPDLIAEAQGHFPDAPNLHLYVGSMDDPLPFADDSFDLCFSNFAIYNAADARTTLLECRRVMAPGAELVLIGPTKNNAAELYDFNERLTGERIDERTRRRTDRIAREILPIAQAVFPSVTTEIINSFLTFPNQDEFIRYFRATLLYEEIAEKKEYSLDEMRAACSAERDIILSKEMIAVVAAQT
jgi:ubiquinone/menaquinone biosynthesis C-methylase UbiE